VFDNEAEATQDVKQIDVDPPEISADDEAIIIYTSGTTGKPKGCLLSHGNVIANARQISEWLGFGVGDRLLTIMPLFHMNAVSVTTMAALYAGGSSVVSPGSPRRASGRSFRIIRSPHLVPLRRCFLCF
jgi:Acyl-CoA synthetases (AMP-forming)/AMP-acid ligases II